MPERRRAACLLVTNLFPPALGGSSEVYAALAVHARGDIAVLTASHNHQTGGEREGWQALDRHASHPIHRIRCIRPFSRSLYSGWTLFYRLHEAATALKLALTVLRLALRYRVRAICIADDETVGWLTLVGRLLGQRSLIYCHGDDLKCAKEAARRRSRWFHRAGTIVAASHYAGGLLIADFGVPPDKIAVIQNGVNRKAFFPQAASPSFLQRHGFQGRRVVLTVTRLVARKGVDKVLEALPAIAREFPDLIYVVAGDGPQRAELEQRAQALGLGEAVCFTGAIPHDQTREFYNAAEIFLLPNREEAGEADGLPLVFLEANACGKPVIGGKAGGTAEIVRNGENGVLVDGCDVGAIAAALRDLLRDDGKRAAMAQKGLQMAQDWDWAVRADAFLALCRS